MESTEPQRAQRQPGQAFGTGALLGVSTVVGLYAVSWLTENFLPVFFGPPILVGSAVLAALVLFLTGRPELHYRARVLLVAAAVVTFCGIFMISSFTFTS